MKRTFIISIALVSLIIYLCFEVSFGQKQTNRQDEKVNSASDECISSDAELCFDVKAKKPEMKGAKSKRKINGKVVLYSDCCPIMVKTINNPKPCYPSFLKLTRPKGKVVIRVVVDEKGKVIWAKAESGHPLLRGVALRAACRTTFKPYTCICGKEETIKFETLLTYDFNP